jgi:hypothetical protein
VGAEHLCDCRSRCFLRDDAACPNLGRPKEKGRRIVWGTAPSTTGSLVCVGASRLFESYRLAREVHCTTSRDACHQASPHQNLVGATNGSAPRQGAGSGTGSDPTAPQPQSYIHPRRVRIRSLDRSSAIGAACIFRATLETDGACRKHPCNGDMGWGRRRPPLPRSCELLVGSISGAPTANL